MERRSGSISPITLSPPESPIRRNSRDWESGTDTEKWTPDGSDSSNGDNSDELAVDLLAEDSKPTENYTQESQANTHTSQATCTPSSSSPNTADRRWRALMYLDVEEFLKLDIIHKIIEKLSVDDLVDVVEEALNIDDLDFTVQAHTQFEVVCASQMQRIDYFNRYMREEGAQIFEIKEDAKQLLHNELYQFCRRNPQKKREMLRNQLRQVSTLKAFNALAGQIWRLPEEERDKLGNDAIRYFERRSEVDPNCHWPPVRW